ncbi:hypothetical protein Pan161_02150 [Gimesia algae]|uniref:Uncharacterized protein n=1 Tax=Gimesia algae TaxID=2527971 RepID=A0A517V6G5_9PLAN|nr:hypothetical protein Pan161_02150 [Gimesia algae]
MTTLLAGGSQVLKYLTVHELITCPTVKALCVAILPRTARFDIQRLHVGLFKPFTNRLGDEFTAIVTPDMFRHSVRLKQFSQDIDHVLTGDMTDRQLHIQSKLGIP